MYNYDSKLIQEFEILEKKLYNETAILSSTHQIRDSTHQIRDSISFKKIVSRGDEFLSLIMYRIIEENEKNITYYLLSREIIGSIYPNNGKGYKELMDSDYKIWWQENKSKYGK